MTDEALAHRITAIVGMLTETFNQTASKARIAGYLDATECIPDRLFAESVKRATMTCDTGFPPTPGQIVKAARELEPGRRSQSGHVAAPGWEQRYLERKRRELNRLREIEAGGGELGRIVGRIGKGGGQ